MNSRATLKSSLKVVLKRASHGSISIRDILCALPGKTKWVGVVILAIPFCLPIQIPGLSTPFGIAIVLMGLRIIFKGNLWLPKQLLSKKISSSQLKKIVNKTEHVLTKIERYIHPRLAWMNQQPVMKTFNALMIVFLGSFLALPLPIPFTNLVAAWPIVLIGVGMLEEDGLLIIMGHAIVVSAAALSLMSFLFFYS